MKKLFYVVRYPLYMNFNLKQKFDGQLNAFKNLGYDVYYIGFDKRYFYLIHGDDKTIIGKTHFYIPNYFHTALYSDYNKVSRKVISEHDIDIIYFRACPICPSTVKMANQIKEENITFFYEKPTYIASTTEQTLNCLRTLYFMISERWTEKVFSVVSMFLMIGDPSPEKYYGKPACNIRNGIDVDRMPIRCPDIIEDEIHILALSSMCEWHGYDRLIRSLAEYEGSESVYIHFVGGNGGGCLQEWKALAHEKKLDDRVIFHGPLYGDELDQVFSLCNIGVNALGMYRKGSDVSAELKTKEYVARGLPFVSSVRDEMIDGVDSDLYMKVENNDYTPSMEEIVEFALRTRKDESAITRLREYAIEHLSWEEQYSNAFDYYEGIKKDD